MKKLAGLIALVPFIMGIILLSSCGNTRQMQYFQGQFDTVKLSQAKYPEPVIQKNDLIGIDIYSDDPRASAYFNLAGQSSASNTGGAVTSNPVSSSETGSTYLVDEAGNIQMPGLGKMQVAGLMKRQLDSLITSQLKEKLQNPYVIIRMLSYKITLLGEVSKPGQFIIPNERVSLLEAIAMAGDLTPYGRRENILVIREINGQRTFARLDLKNPEILGSPFFYLQPNDMVYVEVNKTKAALNDQVVVRNITVAATIISLIAVVVTLSRTN